MIVTVLLNSWYFNWLQYLSYSLVRIQQNTVTDPYEVNEQKTIGNSPLVDSSPSCFTVTIYQSPLTSHT